MFISGVELPANDKSFGESSFSSLSSEGGFAWLGNLSIKFGILIEKLFFFIEVLILFLPHYIQLVYQFRILVHFSDDFFVLAFHNSIGACGDLK